MAKEWIVTGAVLTAYEAKSFGIINRFVEGDVLHEAVTFAKQIGNGAPLSQKYVKYMLNHRKDADWKTVLQHEIMIQTFLMQTDDHNEAVQAFFEKRSPVFIGR
ncbi:enoyl-CoA hydratase/isomerase family protein [Brevibacillus centrosporus]|uniref:enoyl-CoA hydratase/isomerase family protein n=1 Tax=Brevibacillus centrosporus TaxID=54910 RepID=UPI002E1A68F0|nr:enoyl-CoA hydratase-related protein [Brevibacillus centrosporus]MED1949638.1 enoyl-CoA hydratase-related protein [Brevibacillus centrosporus]